MQPSQAQDFQTGQFQLYGEDHAVGWDGSNTLLGSMTDGLLSLWVVMEKFNARRWLFLSEYLTGTEIIRGSVLESDTYPIEDPEEEIKVLQYMRVECHSLGLTLSVYSLDWIIAELGKTPPPTKAKLSHMFAELKRRIKDEISSVLFLRIPASHARFYEDAFLFGEQVAQSFPSVDRGFAEAGKCLALGRNTACVFHLMRVIEVGLRTLASALRIRVKKSKPTWGDFLTAIDNKMRPIPGKKNPWQKHEPFISEARIHIRDISTAWRNPLVHTISVFYDEQDAQVIFRHTEAFMRHLATRLREGTRRLL